MQQLLVVLAVHLMSVVAGPGRAGAAPVQPLSISTTTLRPSHHHLPGHRHRSHASSDLTPWRRERSLGVWSSPNPLKFLTSKHGWTLEIMPNGSVSSTREPRPKFGILQTEGVNQRNLGLPTTTTSQYSAVNNTAHYGKVAILGYHSHRYLCMGKNGHIYTRHRDEQVKKFSRECVFVEYMHKHFYYTYCSYSFPKPKLRTDGTERRRKKKWCLGINRNGTLRLGKRTKDSHSFAQFTPRPAEDPVTPFPAPSADTTRPVSQVTPTPSPRVVKGPNPTESRKNKGPKRTGRRRNRHRNKESRGCKGPGLFNIRCSDDGDVISDVSELRRKSSRRRSRGRSRTSNKRRKGRRKASRIETIGLFTG